MADDRFDWFTVLKQFAQMRKSHHFIGLAVLLLANGTKAQEVPPTTPTEAAVPATAIATKTLATDNADIAGRIRSIYSEIVALRGVRIRVSAGVVTLSGTVPSADDIRQADAIASRVSGVVTVQNDITRNLDVNTNLSPALGQFGQDIRAMVQALPLVGVALVIGLLIGFIGYMLASIDRLWRYVMPNPFLAELAATFVRFVFIILGLIAALEVLGCRFPLRSDPGFSSRSDPGGSYVPLYET